LGQNLLDFGVTWTRIWIPYNIVKLVLSLISQNLISASSITSSPHHCLHKGCSKTFLSSCLHVVDVKLYSSVVFVIIFVILIIIMCNKNKMSLS